MAGSTLTLPTVDAPEDIQRTAKRWRKTPGSLIMALHEVQGRYGYVPREAALQLGALMNVPMARIFEVLTFYNYFKMTPPGRFTISVCTGTACHLKGAPELIAAFTAEIGIGEGESSDDGLFHLQGVRCLGCCGLAPVVTVNGQVHGKMTADKVPALVAQCRAEAAAEPLQGVTP